MQAPSFSKLALDVNPVPVMVPVMAPAPPRAGEPGVRIGLVDLAPLLAEGLAAALAAEGDAGAGGEPRWQVEVMAGFDAADAYVLQPHDAAEAAALQRRLPPRAAVVWLGAAPPAQPIAAARPPGALQRAPRAEAVLEVDVTPRQLRAALGAVLNGLAVRMPWDVAASGAAAPGPGAPGEPRGRTTAAAAAAALADTTEPLTTRELEVYELLAKGLSNRDVAAVLGISSHTAKFHVAQILAKVGAATRAEAVAIGLRLGLIGL